MNRLIGYTKAKFMATMRALLMMGLFLVRPTPAAAQDYWIEFWADATQIRPGQCVGIHWDTSNVREVYYNNQPVSGITQTRLECPAFSAPYELLVITKDGQQIRRQVYIQVLDWPANWNYNWENWNSRQNQNMFINFWANQTQIRAGQCVDIYWHTENVREVYYNNQPVSGIQQRRVECPAWSTTYNLLVITRDGQQIHRQIEVQVDQPAIWNGWYSGVIINFWADRSHISAGECVTVYWQTENVREVYYNGQPVSGIQQSQVECPGESTTYDLLVITRNNLQILRQARVDVSGRLPDRGDVTMRAGQRVDFDDDGRVSDNGDDFRWLWSGGERGIIAKVDDDRDLLLAVLGRGGSDSFEDVSEDDCQELLDDEDSDQVDVSEESIICIRTDAGDYGKLWVDDVRRADGRLELEWRVW